MTNRNDGKPCLLLLTQTQINKKAYRIGNRNCVECWVWKWMQKLKIASFDTLFNVTAHEIQNTNYGSGRQRYYQFNCCLYSSLRSHPKWWITLHPLFCLWHNFLLILFVTFDIYIQYFILEFILKIHIHIWFYPIAQILLHISFCWVHIEFYNEPSCII